jgi:hypothetical protein
MARILYAAFFLGLASTTITLRAVGGPRAGTDGQPAVVWTNDDLEKLHVLGMISIIGGVEEATSPSTPAPESYVKTQDPHWYAVEAAKLRAELQRRQTELDQYRQAIDDARDLRETSGGLNLLQDAIGITPGSGLEILQQGVNEIQAKFDALEDLARRNGIPPGALRAR